MTGKNQQLQNKNKRTVTTPTRYYHIKGNARQEKKGFFKTLKIDISKSTKDFHGVGGVSLPQSAAKAWSGDTISIRGLSCTHVTKTWASAPLKRRHVRAYGSSERKRPVAAKGRIQDHERPGRTSKPAKRRCTSSKSGKKLGRLMLGRGVLSTDNFVEEEKPLTSW